MSGTEYKVQKIGSSEQPVVVIDDFHPEPDRLRDMATRASYKTLNPYYPGVQAPADPRHLGPVEAVLSDVFRSIFSIEKGVSIIQCSFSIVTTPEADLAPIQRLPHIDTPDPGRIALLHYLSGEETGGTAFYRHIVTGAEVIHQNQFQSYAKALESEGLPKAGYMRGSDARFEQIGHVPAKPNRAVLYRSQLLHSGQIPDGFHFSDDPAKGRLTLNSFFQARS